MLLWKLSLGACSPACSGTPWFPLVSSYPRSWWLGSTKHKPCWCSSVKSLLSIDSKSKLLILFAGRRSPENIKPWRPAVWDESSWDLASSEKLWWGSSFGCPGPSAARYFVCNVDLCSRHIPLVLWERWRGRRQPSGVLGAGVPGWGCQRLAQKGQPWLLHHLQLLCGRMQRKGGEALTGWMERSFKQPEDKLLLIKACVIYGMSFACQNFPKQS